jgi:hypothetical protein
MATKKLAEVIGNQDTEAATWQKIRADLRDDIAAAFKLAVEYEGSTELGRMLGLTETARRLAIEKAIAGPFVANPDWLLLKIQQIKDAASVPPQAFDFFRIFLNTYSQKWAEHCAKILAAALPIAERELALAVAIEESFFADAGLPRQETTLAAGVGRVVEKLKSSQAHFARLLQSPHRESFPPPAPSALAEILADETAKQAAALAALASEKDLSA